MANPYSEEIRKKALSMVEKGLSVLEVVKLLDISKSSLYLWQKQLREDNTLAPKKDWRKGHSSKVTDLEVFRKFAEENEGLSAKEMADKWGNISKKTICKWLHRIGFTRKKRLTVTQKEAKKNAEFIWTR